MNEGKQYVWLVERDYGHGVTSVAAIFASEPSARAFAAQERERYGLDILRPELRAVVQAAKAEPYINGPEDIDVTRREVLP